MPSLTSHWLELFLFHSSIYIYIYISFIPQDILIGPFFPNASIIIPELHPKECNRSPKVGSAGEGGGLPVQHLHRPK